MRPNEQHSALPEGLSELMIQLHSSCASSASIERIFLSFGLIQNEISNGLGVEKAAKLVFCYRMFRGKEDLDYQLPPYRSSANVGPLIV